MTSTVTVKAHCASNKEVLVTIDTQSTGERILLQDGETLERVVYDDRVITVSEQLKEEAG